MAYLVMAYVVMAYVVVAQILTAHMVAALTYVCMCSPVYPRVCAREHGVQSFTHEVGHASYCGACVVRYCQHHM